MTSQFNKALKDLRTVETEAIMNKVSLEVQGQTNLSKIKEEMRNFDTHAPLKAAKEISPVAHRIQLLMHMALELDHRGLESVIACATFHRRYPKGA